jgi:hypothetical protein
MSVTQLFQAPAGSESALHLEMVVSDQTQARLRNRGYDRPVRCGTIAKQRLRQIPSLPRDFATAAPTPYFLLPYSLECRGYDTLNSPDS